MAPTDAARTLDIVADSQTAAAFVSLPIAWNTATQAQI